MAKLSEIKFCFEDFKYQIELPNTDMYNELSSYIDVMDFIVVYGDVECELSNNTITVPSFKESRMNFISSKLSNCELWGNE